MNGDRSNNNNPPQNDRVSDDAAKSLQNILNSVRTSVENEFAIQQMEYEEIYGVDSSEYEAYLNKVGTWLRANKLIDMVMDLLPISLMMDMATSQDNNPQPDPNISPTLPSMPIPSAAQQLASSQGQYPNQANPQPVQSQAQNTPQPVYQNVQETPGWGPPPGQDPNSQFSQISSESIQAIDGQGNIADLNTNQVEAPQQSSNMAGTPELDSIFPAPQPQQIQQQVQQDYQEEPLEENLASPHEMAAQKSAYIPNNAWQSSDPQMSAPSMPMPPPPPPKSTNQETAPDLSTNAIGANIPDDQFESMETELPIQEQTHDYGGIESAPPSMPPTPPKMPPPPPPKTPPSVPFMPPSPPPKNASSIPDESLDLFDELRRSQGQTEGDGFESGTWANQNSQDQDSASDILAAPQESPQTQAPATGWEQVEEVEQPDANTWAPPAGENHPQPPPPPPLPQQQQQQQQPAANAWESPQGEIQHQSTSAVSSQNAWGPPQGQNDQTAEPKQQPDPNAWGEPQSHENLPQQQPQQQVQANAWGEPQSHENLPQQQPQQQVQANAWGEPQSHENLPQQQPQQQVQANAWGEPQSHENLPQQQPDQNNAWGPPQGQQQPPAQPQNGQNGEPKKEEKEGDSFVFDPTTAWG